MQATQSISKTLGSGLGGNTVDMSEREPHAPRYQSALADAIQPLLACVSVFSRARTDCSSLSRPDYHESFDISATSNQDVGGENCLQPKARRRTAAETYDCQLTGQLYGEHDTKEGCKQSNLEQDPMRVRAALLSGPFRARPVGPRLLHGDTQLAGRQRFLG